MKDKLLMDTAVLAGEIMLSSGAETYRVEDTMNHILRTSKRQSIDVLALMTGIVATINDEEMQQPITAVKAIHKRSTNLNNIIKVNEISRSYCGGNLSLEEAYASLKNVKEKLYGRVVFNFATVLVTTGFAMMFGGRAVDVFAAALAGVWLAVCLMFANVTHMSTILTDIASTAGIAMLIMSLQAFLIPGISTDIAIVSTIMPLVPGVAITNAVRDVLHRDYLSGCARILESFLKAGSIAIGVGIGMALFRIVLGGVLR
ncbi:MAG: threonine/serine exporter family protein [Faecalimonas sp.]|nr:threonine/serine exporter family protein [Faecalimonas sp.]